MRYYLAQLLRLLLMAVVLLVAPIGLAAAFYFGAGPAASVATHTPVALALVTRQEFTLAGFIIGLGVDVDAVRPAGRHRTRY
jgi:hypothetical protein